MDALLVTFHFSSREWNAVSLKPIVLVMDADQLSFALLEFSKAFQQLPSMYWTTIGKGKSSRKEVKHIR